ncbi:MAG: GTP-binding protein [Bacteroidaceae bacterium]|nr:GTP-binding protein [Bacteroidaceae bacterium]
MKVLLITGYLGSGKTTLLNRILNNNRGIKFAVIVNDIGEVNIDADLIQKGGIVDQQDDSLVALQNGCICCNLKMNLVEQLKDINDTGRFDYIVIEASGICEPAPIAQTICSYRQLTETDLDSEDITLDCICSVVDALRLKDEFNTGLDLTGQTLAEDDIANLVIQQIEFCNIILLNKADEVSKDELGRITQILHTLQPKAEIIPCNYGDVDFDKILNTGIFDFEKVSTSAKWIEELEKNHEEGHEHRHEHEEHEHEHHHHEHEENEHHHEHEHHHHDEECHHHGDGHCSCGHHHDESHPHGEEYGISTWVFYSRKPMDLGLFDHFVARQWPKSVIRAKGMCYFKGEEHMCYLFEQAGRQVSLRQAGQWYATMPEDELKPILAHDARLQADWDEEYGDRMQKLVFIGQHMDTDDLKAKLQACLTD